MFHRHQSAQFPPEGKMHEQGPAQHRRRETGRSRVPWRKTLNDRLQNKSRKCRGRNRILEEDFTGLVRVLKFPFFYFKGVFREPSVLPVDLDTGPEMYADG